MPMGIITYKELIQIFNKNVLNLNSFLETVHSSQLKLSKEIKTKVLELGERSITARIYRFTITDKSVFYHHSIINAWQAYLVAKNLDDFIERLNQIDLPLEIKKYSCKYFALNHPKAITAKRKLEKFQESKEEKEPIQRKKFARSNAATGDGLAAKLGIPFAKGNRLPSRTLPSFATKEPNMTPLFAPTRIELLHDQTISVVNAFMYPYISGLKLERDSNDCLMKNLVGDSLMQELTEKCIEQQHAENPLVQRLIIKCEFWDKIEKAALQIYLARSAFWFYRLDENSQKSRLDYMKKDPEQIMKLLIEKVMKLKSDKDFLASDLNSAQLLHCVAQLLMDEVKPSLEKDFPELNLNSNQIFQYFIHAVLTVNSTLQEKQDWYLMRIATIKTANLCNLKKMCEQAQQRNADGSINQKMINEIKSSGKNTSNTDEDTIEVDESL